MKYKAIEFFIYILLWLTLSASAVAKAEENIAAPEFEEGLPWINVTRSLTLKDLKGKVVILDFWTYGCINCVHVIPDLKRLEKKYGHQLVVIGVHSPKFENEKNLEMLRKVVYRYDVKHPVVSDIDFTLWKQYGVRAWPTLVVLDPESNVYGSVTGEGNYEVLDRTVARLVKNFEDQLSDHLIPTVVAPTERSLLSSPGKIIVNDRWVVISDSRHHRIIVSDHTGRVNAVYGGHRSGFVDGGIGAVKFNFPQGLAFGSEGVVYVADTGNHRIRQINLARQRVTTIAGQEKVDQLKVAGEKSPYAVSLRSPWALAYEDGLLYIALAGSHQIWRMDLVDNAIAPLAGSGREGIDDGPALESTFSQPSGLSLVGDTLFVADAEDSAIRAIDLVDEEVTTLVGTGLFDFGDQDGALKQAKIQHVQGVAAINEDKLIIADTYNHKLKLLDLNNKKIKTIAGVGQPGAGVGFPLESGLNEPGGIAIFGGKVWVADTNNNRIVQYDLDTEQLVEWLIYPFEGGREKSDIFGLQQED